jgi:(1->4)-alpha-D-glucan 1-alpha-D-glucosylmutase
MNSEFTFDDAAAVTEYLADLGVSHLYSSPYLQAAPGSTHGYDVVDHSRPNDELGGQPGHARLCQALDQAGLGHVLDIVPNHMAIGTDRNRWWWDVLENGPSSVYASYFDVDWDPPEKKLRDLVLLPILGDHYGRVLEAGQITLERDGGTFLFRYVEHTMPVAPPTLDGILAVAAEAIDHDELESIGAAVTKLPHSSATDRESVRERHRDKEVLRSRLAQLAEDPEVAAALDKAVAAVNADVDALDALLERQNYRLAFWRTAGQELDYRRFFDITTLIGLRTEDPAVFDDTHELVLRWVEEGVLDGLRIDHPDGLRDPSGYLHRLAEAASGAWIVVEKILEVGEDLPTEWPVAGTTGYDFLNLAGGLFVDPAGEAPLTALFRDLTGVKETYPELVLECKDLVMRQVLAADIRRLTERFVHVCERHRRYRDYTRQELHQVLHETIASFGVYRTYVRAEDGAVADTDVVHVEAATQAAIARRPDLDPDLFGFLRDLLLLRVRAPGGAPGLPEAAPAGSPENELAMRFQQATGPIMAKGVEDTAFYRYHRLVALNEVGGDPNHFGVSVPEFHAACQARQRDWPVAMLATSTHDTKRSEDVRARIGLLSEVAEEWALAVRRWRSINGRHRVGQWPDPSAELLLYQVLVGAWPLSADRAVAYMEKATKEAKEHTTWIDPDPAYDDAIASFVRAILGDAAFIDALTAFVAPLIQLGRVTSLAQTMVKLTAPGVPDIYQGTELWDLSLVDPDNRRPVDYALRRRLLSELETLSAEAVWQRSDEGLPKLLVIKRALDLRARRPELFGPASTYEPLLVSGPQADRVVAFARGGGAVTVVPRLVAGLAAGGGWSDTTVGLPDGQWRDVLSGQRLAGGTQAVAEILGRFPVALLEQV